ncbi:hypothetical protein HYV82_06670 [Candidatus Woesearchaeota archaeon]|nr:hypothetical protein [Candidatus Woesearchaeota archaeon]
MVVSGDSIHDMFWRIQYGRYANGDDFLRDVNELFASAQSLAGFTGGSDLIAESALSQLIQHAESFGAVEGLRASYLSHARERALMDVHSGNPPLSFLGNLERLGGIPKDVIDEFRKPTLEAVIAGLVSRRVEPWKADRGIEPFQYAGEDAKRLREAFLGPAEHHISNFLAAQPETESALDWALSYLMRVSPPEQAILDNLTRRIVFFMERGSIEFAARLLSHLPWEKSAEGVYEALVKGFFRGEYNHMILSIADAILAMDEKTPIPRYAAKILITYIGHDVNPYGYDGVQSAVRLLERRSGNEGSTEPEKDARQIRRLLQPVVAKRSGLAAVHNPVPIVRTYRELCGELDAGMRKGVDAAVGTLLIFNGEFEEAYDLALSAVDKPEDVDPDIFRNGILGYRELLMRNREMRAHEKLDALRKYAVSLSTLEESFGGRLDYGLADEINTTARMAVARNSIFTLQHLCILAEVWKDMRGTLLSQVIDDAELKSGLEATLIQGYRLVDENERLSIGLKYAIKSELGAAQRLFGYRVVTAESMRAEAAGAGNRGAGERYVGSLGSPAAVVQETPQQHVTVYVGSKRIIGEAAQDYALGAMSKLEGRLSVKPELVSRDLLLKGLAANEGFGELLHGVSVAAADAVAALRELRGAVRAVELPGSYLGSGSGPKSPLGMLNLALNSQGDDGAVTIADSHGNAFAQYQIDGLVRILGSSGSGSGTQAASSGTNGAAQMAGPVHRGTAYRK